MILVTGSTGFIGSHLIERLKKEDRNFREFKGDFTRLVDVERNLRDVSTVIHLGALTFVPTSFDTPWTYFETNTLGTLNFLKCRRYYERFVHISTSHIYGMQFKYPIEEDAMPRPLDPYSISKLAGEQLVRVFGEAYDLPYTVVRPFNQFGERQSKKFLIPKLVRESMEGSPVLYGNSERDFLYVENTVDALIKILDNPEKTYQRIYNVCSGECRWISEIAEMVVKLVKGIGAKIEVKEMDRPTDIPKLHGSYESINKDLGWMPRIGLEEGLKRTVGWYKNVYQNNVSRT